MNKSVMKLLVLSLAIAALSVSGCGKDKKSEGNDTPVKGAKAAPGGGGHGTKATAGGAGSFAHFPAQSNAVVGINFKALRASKLWEKFGPMLEQKGSKELSEFKDLCGIDPYSAVSSFSVGGTIGDDKSMVITLKSNVDKAKAIDCAKKVSEKQGVPLDIEEDGDIVGFKGGDDSVYVAWLADGTIVTGAGAKGNKDWLKKVISGGSSVKDNKDFMRVAGKANKAASVWFAALPSPDSNPLNGMTPGAPPTAVYGSVDFTSGLKVNAGLQYAKAEDAKAMADQVNAMMGPMKADPNMGKFLSKASVTAAGTELVIKVNLNGGEFDDLLAMMQKQLAPMLMMMGGGM